jgi:heat shock protein HspQ
MKFRTAKYAIGQVVKHRVYPFRGVIFDVDPTFSNTFYHLLAENSEVEYIAYVSEQNLVPDTSRDPLRHPQVQEIFKRGRDGAYRMKAASLN